MNMVLYTYRIRIIGLVQGVGFRPFIYKLARSYGLVGTVDNRNDGVLIFTKTNKKTLERFVEDIKLKAPKAACIENIEFLTVDAKYFGDFRIVKSDNNTILDEITEVCPDIAICDNCLNDIQHQIHRLNYPLTNCTHCGPRFSIIKALPYDRPNTTMADFSLCPTCNKEYTDVEDRRFHAQPVACNNCGPTYSLYYQDIRLNKIEAILDFASKLLKSGKTIVLKGMGGYNLICNAENEKAVLKLRKSKHRDGKPLAVMFKDIDTINKYAEISKNEYAELSSWRRPIVLVKQKIKLAESVNMGFSRVGAMLPYMAFHYMLFRKSEANALVFTSANIGGEPIIIDDAIAVNVFLKKDLAVISYNRDIYNRVDDTVCFVVNNKTSLIRRSRGFVPSPIRSHIDVDGILAMGAELVNTFCIGRLNQAIMSQHIGDLKNGETLEFYQESISRFSNLYKFKPALLSCDLHPDYLSTKYAESLNLPLIKVQHHHAHMASCMFENNLDEKVLAVVLDGTGYGEDGKIWGAEFLIGDLVAFDRFAHFQEIDLPGGDMVVQQPWRTAISYLYSAFGKGVTDLNIPFIKNLKRETLDVILKMIDKKINCPKSTSAGRLFDAVAALTGVCYVANFHAEAPMRLEDRLPDDVCSDAEYEYSIHNNVVYFDRMFISIVNDIANSVDTQEIALKFHNTVVNVCCELCNLMRSESGINKLVLSGGSFQNAFLSKKLENRLINNGFEVFVHSKVPSNDGGIALGQLAVASKRIMDFNNIKN